MAAAVHYEVGVAGATPCQPVERIATSTAVADVLDDHGLLRAEVVRDEKPCLDRVTSVAGECHVEHLGVADGGLHGSELCIDIAGTSLIDFTCPELVEVGRLVDLRQIGTKLGKWQVDEQGVQSSLRSSGHECPESRTSPDSKRYHRRWECSATGCGTSGSRYLSTRPKPRPPAPPSNPIRAAEHFLCASLRTPTSHGSFPPGAPRPPTGGRGLEPLAPYRRADPQTQKRVSRPLVWPFVRRYPAVPRTCAREIFTDTGGQPGWGAWAKMTTENVVGWVRDPPSSEPRLFRAVAGLSTSATEPIRAPVGRARESPSPAGRRLGTGRTTDCDRPQKPDDPIGMRSARRYRPGDRGTTGLVCNCLVGAARSPPRLRTWGDSHWCPSSTAARGAWSPAGPPELHACPLPAAASSPKGLQAITLPTTTRDSNRQRSGNPSTQCTAEKGET